MDFLLKANPDLLTLEEQAEQCLLPDVLSVGDIAKLWSPEKQKPIADCLIYEVASKNIILFSYFDKETGKYLKAGNNFNKCLESVKKNATDIAESLNSGGLSPFAKSFASVFDDAPSYRDILRIDKKDFKQWLVDNNQWPLERCLLVNWLLDKKEIQFKSDLLKTPRKQDGWFDLISDMTREFYKEHKKIPNEAQAWGVLWECSIHGYIVTTGKDNGEDCLNMAGCSPLGHSAFKKRWSNYTNKPR